MLDIQNEFKKLEDNYQATLGIYAVDIKSGANIGYHQDERFAFTSTYKAIMSGIILKNFTDGQLNKRVFYSKADLVDYSPITQDHVADD